MKLNTLLIKLVSLVSVTTLVACSSTTPKMVISPQVLTNKTNAYLQKSAQVLVSDLRNKIHIIEIVKDDNAAELISSAENLTSIIDNSIKQAFVNNGLNIADIANNQIEVIINNAQIRVMQDLVKYKTSGLITLTAQIQSKDQTLTKTFNSRSNSEGVLTADLAVLERDFSQQLAKLIVQIVNDPQLQQFIR